MNKYNFCTWNAVDETTSLLENGDISSDTAWDVDDVAPFGDNDFDWQYQPSVYQTAVFGGDWSKGLSQALALEAGRSYFFSMSLQSGSSNDMDFYILLFNGVTYIELLNERLNNEGKVFNFEFTADQDYDKIMVITNNFGGGVTPIGRVFFLNAIENEYGSSCDHALPVIQGDTLKIYFNEDIDENELAFSNLRVGIFNENIRLVPIVSLNKVVVSGDIYNFYFEWVVPVLPKGNFQFFIDLSGLLKYTSNHFIVTNKTYHTAIIKYRNTNDILGYLYESIPTFYNQFRIDLWEGLPQWPNESKGYKTYTGDFITVKSDIQKHREFVLPYVSEQVMEGFIAATMHDELYIDDVRYKKPEGENIAIEWSREDVRIGTGTINLQEVDYSKSIESC